jgi:hypothetical protein
MKTALTLIAAGLVAALVAAGGTFAVAGKDKRNLEVMTATSADTLHGGVARGFNANCPAGWVVTGGGWQTDISENSTPTRVLRDRPVENDGALDGGGWQVVVANLGTLGNPDDDVYVTVWAICAQLP